MDDLEGFVAIKLDPDFPLKDVEAIGAELQQSGLLVPGYIPPERGMLDLSGLRLAELLDRVEHIVLPDRNVVTRIARIAERGAQRPFDQPTQFAADLMAFSQCLNFNFDPLIAFHELAHRLGNAAAHRELSWFRAADEAQSQAWIDVARGRTDRLKVTTPAESSDEDLAAPIDRWERNYVAALKIAKLELTGKRPVDRAIALLDWMVDDFFLAGPAAFFASMYFSPLTERKRLIKQLRSEDRERAIAGVKNAAWDMTYLSNFAQRMREAGEGPYRFFFATADRGLAAIASYIVIDAEEDQLEEAMIARLNGWWNERDARILGREFTARILAVRNRPPPTGLKGLGDPIAHWIAAGEDALRRWRPTDALR